MTKSIVVDTHSAVWYLSSDPRLSRSALSALEAAESASDAIFVPSICLVELTYLIEKRRLPQEAKNRLLAILDDPESGWQLVPLDRRVAEALNEVNRAEVPDLPDRIIAATAVALRCKVVSRDRKIRASRVESVW